MLLSNLLTPKFKHQIAPNTWVVSGTSQIKKFQDILPQIIYQLGSDKLENLKKLVEQFQKQFFRSDLVVR
uniref:Uncharacterized protein n=1 Tax=Solanum lycopersicum TaxID=4081 RepID=A0A3Q7GVC5_SOLLC